jgi:hypothetical protein
VAALLEEEEAIALADCTQQWRRTSRGRDAPRTMVRAPRMPQLPGSTGVPGSLEMLSASRVGGVLAVHCHIRPCSKEKTSRFFSYINRLTIQI